MKTIEPKTKKDKLIAVAISEKRHLFNDIYPHDKPENPVPENSHCIVLFNNNCELGWLEIHKTEDMGLEALIAREWIYYNELMS